MQFDAAPCLSIPPMLPQASTAEAIMNPAPFPSEVADISSIGVVDANSPLEIQFMADTHNAFYSTSMQQTHDRPWDSIAANFTSQNLAEYPYQKIILVLANVTQSLNPVSNLTEDDLLMTLDTILGQNAIYQQQLARDMLPNQELHNMIAEYHAEIQRLNAILLQKDEEHSAFKVQINSLIKEVQNAEKTKEQEMKLITDAHRDEIAAFQHNWNEQEALYKNELQKLTNALKDLAPKETMTQEAQTDKIFELQETLRLSGLVHKDAPAKSALKQTSKKQLGSAHVMFDLEESKRPSSTGITTPHATVKAPSMVRNNLNIEYDLVTDDILLSQLQESLRQTDGDTLKALKLSMEQEIQQLKRELEQVQSQALIMIQQSDQEKNQLCADMVRLQREDEERQFKLEEMQRLLCETYDSLEVAKEQADAEHSRRLKLEQDYAEARDKERSAEMEKERAIEMRIGELTEENQKLENRWSTLKTQYDELHQEYRTVIDVLSNMQGKSLASVAAENAAADLAAIGECAISGVASRVAPLMESVGLSTIFNTPLIGSVPLIDRCLDARPSTYSFSTQTASVASSPTHKQTTDDALLITELELALNQTNNALKQRIAETVAAEQRINELTEQLKTKATELEDATMEINILKLELEEARKTVKLVEGRIQRTQRLCSTTLEKSKAELKEAQTVLNANKGSNQGKPTDKPTSNDTQESDDLSIANLIVGSEPLINKKSKSEIHPEIELEGQILKRLSVETKEKEVRRLSTILSVIGDDYLSIYDELQPRELGGRRLLHCPPPKFQDDSVPSSTGYRERAKPLYSDSEFSDLSQQKIDSQYLEELQTEMQHMKRLIVESTERELLYTTQK